MSLLSFSRHSDLPLEKDPGTRFLPWLIAFMVYLAAISIVATSLMQALSERWEKGVDNTLSVQIPPGESVKEDQDRIADTLAYLRGHPAVVLAEPISKDRVFELLEPWLGSADVLSNMPLPHLIDVQVRSSVDLDGAQMLAGLQKIVAGATLDDHRLWLQRLIYMSRVMEFAAYFILGLIALISIGTVFFVTRTGLAIHHDVIEVLHLIGAQDSYIARQFGEHALYLGLRGGFLGLLAAGPTFGGFAYFYKQVDNSLLPPIDITLVQWIAILTLPLLSAMIGYITARRAVVATLRRMI